MTALDRLLDALPPWVLVGGKGGVGKTTCASAIALRAAARGERALLLSTDPAGTLGDALGSALDGTPRPVPGHPGLFAAQLDAAAARDAFLERWRDVLVAILDRGTYLSATDAAGLVDAALPGLDETMAVLTLLDLEREGWRRVVIDTAPTGHALRLLELPASFQALLALLEAMQEKHRFMVRALTHRYRADDADRFLDAMRARVDALRALLADPARFGVVLVTRPEPLVLEETARFVRSLAELRLPLSAVVVNGVRAGEGGDGDPDALEPWRELATAADGASWYEVPWLPGGTEGTSGIERWGELLGVRGAGGGAREEPGAGQSTPPAASRPRAAASRESRVPSPESRVPAPLAIIGGKGGVGKSTVACALGVATASPEHPVLVVSTDPAPSLADALRQPVGGGVAAVEGAPGLHAQQLDATAAFARFRDRYAARVDELFDSMVHGAMDAAHDRHIVRELLALAPPGIDELYALASLGETIASGRFATVIVDPAPTGHLLRLLELPETALAWTHRLMRIMLEYKELAGLGDAAAELVAFARRTRALAALLRDPERAGVLVVALDEPLVRGETVRLMSRLRSLRVAVRAVVWNRVSREPRPLSVEGNIDQFEAAEVSPPPRGVAALRRWVHAWRSLPPSPHE